MTGDRLATIILATYAALVTILVIVGLSAGLTSPPRNAKPQRAEQVFSRNDTLWVCDAGACRWIAPSWTRCPRRSTS